MQVNLAMYLEVKRRTLLTVNASVAQINTSLSGQLADQAVIPGFLVLKFYTRFSRHHTVAPSYGGLWLSKRGEKKRGFAYKLYTIHLR